MRSLLGVNLPWLYGSYGHDLAPAARHPDWPCDFHLMHAYRPLLEARQIGLEAVRIWLCEGAEGLTLDSAGHVEGPHPKLLESIRLLEEGAAVAGVRIYWGLLDANAAARDGDAITRSILEDRDQAHRFADKVVAEIAAMLDPEIAVALEIVNEPEIVTESCRDVRERSGASIAWDAIGHLLATSHAAVNGKLWVTSGTGYVFLKELWASGARLDAVDIHVYHDEGGLPSRADLASAAGVPVDVPLIAGECGAASKDADPLAVRNYLYNADREHYDAAFLWKLEGELVDTSNKARTFTGLARAITDSLASRPASGFFE